MPRHLGRSTAGQRQSDEDELQATLWGVEMIRDPIRRARQAERVMRLASEMALIRSEAVLEMRAEGLSWRQVAEALGVSRGRAWQLGQLGFGTSQNDRSTAP